MGQELIIIIRWCDGVMFMDAGTVELMGTHQQAREVESADSQSKRDCKECSQRVGDCSGAKEGCTAVWSLKAGLLEKTSKSLAKL